MQQKPGFGVQEQNMCVLGMKAYPHSIHGWQSEECRVLWESKRIRQSDKGSDRVTKEVVRRRARVRQQLSDKLVRYIIIWLGHTE